MGSRDCDLVPVRDCDLVPVARVQTFYVYFYVGPHNEPNIYFSAHSTCFRIVLSLCEDTYGWR